MNRESPADISKLIARCRLGDDRAWHRLVDRYKNLVYSVPRRMGLSAEDADEVFQATWVALHRSLDRIEEPGTVGKWLAVTAGRESLRLIRVRKRQPSTLDDPSTLDQLVASEGNDAEEAAVLAENADSVRDAVLALSSKCRDLLSLLYLADDPKYNEISTQLQIPMGSIGPTRARCLEKLRAELAKSGFFDESEYQTHNVGALGRSKP